MLSNLAAAFSLALSPATESMPPGGRFEDCPDCPEMIVIPAGEFTLGSTAAEKGRGADEGPQQRIRIAARFAVSRFEIRRSEYEAFVKATGHPVGANCITDRRKKGDWKPDAATSLRDPGFTQAGDHPVVCVSWNDAKAYAAWLSARTGQAYRLLSEAEWEYVARAGSTSPYPWGDKPADGCAFMNGTDKTFRGKYPALSYVEDLGCDDGALNTAPVGSYRANAFGVHDMIGNVSEWVEDCSGPYDAKRTDGSPRTGDCAKRVVRGGSWGTIARQLRSAERLNYAPTDLDDSIGIRVARTLR